MISSKKSSIIYKNREVRRNHYPSLSLMNSYGMQVKGETFKDQYSETSLDGNLSKSRSNSIILKPCLHIPISPQSSTVKSLKSKIDLSAPLLDKIVEKKNKKLKISKINKLKDNFLPSPRGQLEKTFNDIMMIYEEYGLNQKVFCLFEQFFSDIISNDKEYAKYLINLKKIYNEWIKINIDKFSQSKSFELEVLQLKNEVQNKNQEIKRISDDYNKKLEEIQKLNRNIKYLCSENLEVGKKIESLSENYQIIRDKLFSITQVSLENFPIDPDTWKALIAGNKEYSNLCKDLKSNLRQLEKREMYYKKILNAIKETGFDLERIIMKFTEDPYSSDNSSQEEIQVSKTKFNIMKTLPNLPKLDVFRIQPSSCSEEYSLDKEIQIY